MKICCFKNCCGMKQKASTANRFLFFHYFVYFFILINIVNCRKYSSSSSSSNSVSSNSQISGSCETALRKCSKQIACGMTLHDYRLSCKQVIYGTSKNCTEICQLSIASLLSTPEGAQYLNCDCGTNEHCRQIRAKTAACNAKNGNSIISQLPPNHPLVQQAALFTNGSSAAVAPINNTSNFYKQNLPTNLSNNFQNTNSSSTFSSSTSSHPSSASAGLNQGFIQQYGLAGAALYPRLSKSRHSNKSHSCRSVELTCRSDVHCSTVYDSYRTNCADALQGDKCTSRCNSSLTLLWKQRNGHNFRNCHCDKGNQRCKRQRANLMKSCYSIGSAASSLNSIFLWLLPVLVLFYLY